MNLNEVFKTDWLKANVNCKQGDIVKFTEELTAFQTTDDKGNPIVKLEGRVEVFRDGKSIDKKKFSVNKTNRKNIQAYLGSDTLKWVGKELMVNVVKANNPKTGTLVDSVVLTQPNVNIDNEIIYQ